MDRSRSGSNLPGLCNPRPQRSNSENSKLLGPPKFTLGGLAILGNRSGSPSGKQLHRRPPIFTVPSSASIRSLRSLNDPIANEYAEEIDFKIHNNKITSKNSNDSSFAARRENRFSYISYYIPVLRWLPSYDFKRDLLGDSLAGISIASFQLPLVLSFTTSLAHLPSMTGVCSMATGAIMYALLGSVPIMIVGPLASLALIYGQLISSQLEFLGKEVASVLLALIGGILLAAGFLRFGFLNTILSRSLLKGFLCAMGLIMILSELEDELGLSYLIKEIDFPKPVTPLDKVLFVFDHWRSVHVLTILISAIALFCTLSVRKLKSHLVGKGFKSAIYIPELLLMVAISTYFSWKFDWNEKGVEIVADLNSDNDGKFISNPLTFSNLSLAKKTFSTSFLCTALGYFDSLIATKNLGARFNYNVLLNRELIALGATNLAASIFGGIPAFGALGRSKINIMAGATSPMAGIVMAIVTIFAAKYLLTYLYFLPKCILGLSTTITGITVLEEVPEDVLFFWRLRGYDELLIFSIVFLLTLFWSAEAGVATGVAIAIFRVIKQSSRSRIHILGRIPNLTVFRNVDELIEESFEQHGSNHIEELISSMEEIEGVLIVKIPEPLTFTNISDLQSRINRIEKYGSLLVHPSQPQTRDIQNIKFVVFDCKGMDKVDISAIQILKELVARYISSDIMVCFARVPIEVRSILSKLGITLMVNKSFSVTQTLYTSVSMGDGFFTSIEDALRAAQLVV